MLTNSSHDCSLSLWERAGARVQSMIADNVEKLLEK
jgi:hypothetical protein